MPRVESPDIDKAHELAEAQRRLPPKIVIDDNDVDFDEHADKAFEAKVFNRTCYLAGPMSGYEDFNFPAFNKAAADLRSRGWKVKNPADRGWGEGNPEGGQMSSEEGWRAFMAEDLRDVCQSDAVVVLPGWENSRGALLETDVAWRVGLPVLAYGDELTEVPRPAPPALYDPETITFDSREVDEFVEYLHGLEETVCEEADRLVSYDRQADYGHPLDDFSKVCGAAQALGIDPSQGPDLHALYMILVKLARLTTTPGHHDSIVDICGYAKTYDMVLKEHARRQADDHLAEAA